MWYLIVGMIQMLIAHGLGLHNGQEQMQFGSAWWLYISEALFYAFFWWAIIKYFIINPARERLDRMKEDCSPEVYEQLSRPRDVYQPWVKPNSKR